MILEATNTSSSENYDLVAQLRANYSVTISLNTNSMIIEESPRNLPSPMVDSKDLLISITIRIFITLNHDRYSHL